MFFLLDKQALPAYLLWYECYHRTYTTKYKISYDNIPGNRLAYLQKASEILKECINLCNKEEESLRYFEFIMENYSSKDSLQLWLMNQKKFLELEMNEADEQLTAHFDLKQKKEEEFQLKKFDNWAFYNENLIPLYVNSSNDFALREGSSFIPLDRKNYNTYTKQNIQGVMLSYSDFLKFNYCTNAISNKNKDSAFYIAGSTINHSRYKKDYDIFLAKIDNENKKINDKVIWLKTFDNILEGNNTYEYPTSILLQKTAISFWLVSSLVNQQFGYEYKQRRK
ncbi:MAG: hypothetical protein IPK10_17500 [Bacteroidetes bacterium]|nr:hypothetical protein [Bacteroidota bacterium]